MSSKKISLADRQQQAGITSATSQPKPDSNLVFSTDAGRITEYKAEKASGSAYNDGAVRLRRETKGRNGKAVITISGIAASHQELTNLAAQLKKKCACGGSVKEGVIEIQGDKRELVESHLKQLGYQCKWAGG